MKNGGSGAADHETAAVEINDEGQLFCSSSRRRGRIPCFSGQEDPDPKVLIWVDGDIFGEHWDVGGVIR
ncbi:hypothetical protein PVL29_021194 [Vitis rotundifolia]|uniref:Uncharacterized protein n=1 Tax=Vitis rotundifolia TaxID=103349 RepID=A0AA38YZ31_VITRO|nr:hypothetical protein PVL29_021194 [Vitis rotundifolia]